MLLIIFLLFVFVLFLTTYTLDEPQCLKSVKERYRLLREHIVKNPGEFPDRFQKLSRPILITGFHGRGNELGYNVNKGSEIGVCVDGDANEVFHVLIHELAHTITDDFKHNEEFWKNFDELKKICEKLRIYEPINKITKFCGKYIRD